MIYKLVFKSEEDMQKALFGCKFINIDCETEYDNEAIAEVDLLSFEMER